MINNETGEVAQSVPLHIYSAFLEVQKKVTSIFKNAEGYGYNYADLSAIKKAVDPILQEHGVVVSQEPTKGGTGVNVTTVFIHVKTGESLIINTEVPMKKTDDPQAFGSAVTYARRYALVSILGLTTDDDDGMSAKVTFEDELKKRCFADDIEELKKLKAYIKDLDFPNWQKRVMHIMAEKREEGLNAQEK